MLLATEGDKPSWQDAYRLTSDYFSACLSAGPGENTASAFAEILSPLGSQIGLIGRNGQIPHCMGTRFNAKVLTAKHCFTALELANKVIISTDLSSYYFKMLDNSHTLAFAEPGIQSADLESLDHAGLEKDWVLADLSHGDTGPEKEPSPSIKLELSALEETDLADAKAYIPSMFLALAELYVDGSEDLTDDVIMDLSPTCRIGAHDSRFLLHGCNTLGGVSGAPVLVFDRKLNTMKVVGIHAGRAKILAGSNICANKFGNGYPNYAVGVTRSMVTAIKEGEVE